MSPEPLRSQSSGVPSAGEGEAPSRDEVRRRINSLYDRAESDTGTFNATRALAIPRQRGGGGRGSQDSVEPALSDLTRQWFDAARAKLGPTVAAPRTEGRRPSARPAPAARAPRPAERPAEPLALEAPRAPEASVPELPAAPVRELPAGPVPAVESRSDTGVWGTGPQPVLGGGAPQWPLPESSLTQLPEPTAVLPAVQDSVIGSYEVSPPASDGALFGTGPATAGIAPYLRGGAADQAPSYTAEWPIDATAATYETALPAPSVSAAYEPAAVTATAFAAPAFAAPAVEPTAFETATFETATVEPAPAVPAYTAPPAYPTPEGATALAPAPPAPAPAVTFAPSPLESPAVPAPVPAPVAPVAFESPAPPPVDVVRSTKAERVIDFARAQIGRPCVWGAAGPGSFDAPGLSQAAWKVAGVTLPRTVQAQAGAGTPVALADVRAGDLVFFHDDLSHVGIWTGNGMMIHAPGPGTPVREESVFFAGQTAIRGAIRPA
ncbi:NlpC/P60 family protein [Streptomyces sp. NPDC051913]|uniref:C40 family peptidase n=1 Tax=Streptomyces sp. NPDC051913 TaxID=3365676 RepID=UPI0037D87EC7